MRVNSNKMSKPAHLVGAGDVLTLVQGETVRVVRVVLPGSRRGPAPEAQTLYDDLTPVVEKRPPAPKTEGKGRPTKKDRRDMRLSRDGTLE